MSRLPILFTILATSLLAEADFVPKGESHPIVAAMKIIGMIATVIFIVVMVYKSVRVVKDDEDDRVHLPD